jgi:hypothetical protein
MTQVAPAQQPPEQVPGPHVASTAIWRSVEPLLSGVLLSPGHPATQTTITAKDRHACHMPASVRRRLSSA